MSSSSSSSSSRKRPLSQTASAIVARAGPVSGSHVLRIDGYSGTKGFGNGSCITSETFAIGGRRWRLHYYPDGYPGYPEWISIYLSLDPADVNTVTAPFEICLLDQEGNPVPLYTKASIPSCTFSKQSGPLGFSQFIKKKDLEESVYLRDDVFSVRCDITMPREFFTKPVSSFVAVPPPNMSLDLVRCLSTGDGADVTFEVGEEKFAAHRFMLAARSSVFKAELLGPMKEKTVACVRIDDMEAKVFKALLHFIYSDSLPVEMEKEDDADVAMAQHLLVAPDRYNIERLKFVCGDMLCNHLSTGTMAGMLTLAEQHGCRGLKEACLKFLVYPGNLKAVMASDGFEHLTRSCPSLLKELASNLAA